MEIDHIKANILMLAKDWDMTLAELAKEAGYSSRQRLNNLFYRGNATEADLENLAAVFEEEPRVLTKKVTPKKFGAAMADPRENIKENLRMICAEQGTAIKALQKKLKYTEPVFRKAYRLGNPRMDILKKICEHFDIDLEELLDPVDPERYGNALIPRIDS